MAVYDVLRVAGVPGGEMGFTATSGALEVPLNGFATPKPFVNASGQSWFAPGDNVLLQAIWPALPYQFGQGSGSHSIDLLWAENGGTTAPVAEFANGLGASLIFLPSACEPLQIEEGANPPGLLLRVPTNLGGSANRVQLLISAASLNVSMVNLPAALDGEVLAMAYHFEVKHTLPLTAAP